MLCIFFDALRAIFSFAVFFGRNFKFVFEMYSFLTIFSFIHILFLCYPFLLLFPLNLVFSHNLNKLRILFRYFVILTWFLFETDSFVSIGSSLIGAPYIFRHYFVVVLNELKYSFYKEWKNKGILEISFWIYLHSLIIFSLLLWFIIWII